MSDTNYQATVGSEVYTIDGANVGAVAGIEQDGDTAFLHVHENGLFGIGTEDFLVPVDKISSIEAGKVTVDRTREDLVGVPAHDSHAPEAPGYFSSLYAWWWREDGE
jgi:sporulation protein YlmC with PRC-barrel domain